MRPFVLLLALPVLACSSERGGTVTPLPVDFALTLEVVTSGVSRPLYLTAPAGDGRLFIVSQAGQVRIVQNDQLLPTPFLDISAKITSGGERGLLSLAFHPRYATNGFFYVNYTDRNGDTVVERYQVSSDANRADPASAKQIPFVKQPFANHNGGHLLFGVDGMLYVGMGDGGSGGDPQGNGQNKATLLGKLLRLDVDRGDPYYCAGWVKSFQYANGRASEPLTWDVASGGSVVSFGEDGAGEMYLISGSGAVYRFARNT